MHRRWLQPPLLLIAAILGACAIDATDTGGAAPPDRIAAPIVLPPASTPRAPAPPASMPEGVSYTGGDGSSVAEAVIVNGTTTDRATTRAEYAWLRNRYPGFRRREVRLVRAKGRYYDAVAFDTAEGVASTVYFDTTATFGKR